MDTHTHNTHTHTHTQHTHNTHTHTHTHTYTHTHAHRGIIGSGLCVFSRHPIVSAHTHLFNVNGSLAEISDGEIFVGKGIMFCRVQTPSGHVAFYNTHVSSTLSETSVCDYVYICCGFKLACGCGWVLLCGHDKDTSITIMFL